MATMEQTTIKDKIAKLRFDRMRLGQSAADIVPIPSSEIAVALVPLTEAEYDHCLEMASLIDAPDNPAGYLRRDRWANAEVLAYAIRTPGKLEERIFSSGSDLRDNMEVTDINFIMDRYYEMVDRSSPTLDGFSDEEIELVKKALAVIDLKGLYGPQWYALKRFLSTISPEQLGDNSAMFGSIRQLTTKKSEPESMTDADPNSIQPPVKSATSPSTEKESPSPDS